MRQQHEDAASANTPCVLDEDLALESSGEHELASVRQLVLRQSNISSLSPNAAIGMVNLTVLSLSHNAVRSLAGFGSLCALEEVNLNFNQVAEFGELVECRELRKVYLSNNLLSGVSGVQRLPSLRTLCLFKNKIHALAETLEILRLCPKLRELDLDGNPMCGREQAFKHHVVRTLLRLELFDGDAVLPLDREMSREYFTKERPSSAPSSFDWNKLGSTEKKVELFDDDKLNLDPIMLNYVANDLIAQEEINREKTSFVGRLRRNASDHTDPKQQEEAASPVRSTVLKEQRNVIKKPSVDVSDPYETIRRLIRLVETLQAKKQEVEEESDDGESEVDRLRLENRNMYGLRAENGDLKAKIALLVAREGEWMAEKGSLEEMLAESGRRFQALQLDVITGSSTMERPKTAAEIMQECDEEMDDELKELFKTNEANLAEVRKEVEDLKEQEEKVSSSWPAAAASRPVSSRPASAASSTSRPASSSSSSSRPAASSSSRPMTVSSVSAAASRPASAASSRPMTASSSTSRPMTAAADNGRPMTSREKRVASLRPSSARPSSSSSSSRRRPPSPPTVADILDLRKRDDDDDDDEEDRWAPSRRTFNREGFDEEDLLNDDDEDVDGEDRRFANDNNDDDEDDKPVPDSVSTTKHAWLLWEDNPPSESPR